MARISTLLNLLTYCIALIGYAPLSPYLETAPRIGFPAALIWSVIADRKERWLKGSFSTIVSILFFIFYASRFSMENLVEPATNLLVVLLSVRLVSEKKGRNYLQIFALSLFSLAGSSLFSLDSIFLAYLVSLFFLMAAALVILTFYGADNNLVLPKGGIKTVLSVSLLMPAAALPLMLFFFAILPRTQYPLWDFLNATGSKVSGFNEKVQPGSTASIGELKETAFRAQCEKIDKARLYWRGVVLNSYTGNAWVKGNLPSNESDRVTKGAIVRQTVYAESAKSGYLFTLNAPFRVFGVRGAMSGDLVFKSRPFSSRKIRYEVESVPGSPISTAGGIDRKYYLSLPSTLSPRMAYLGRKIAWKGKTDAEKTELLKGFYISSKLSYTTSGLPVSKDPLDEFLFEKKRGNCEFFAASFALLLRAAGVPSRLVGGYFGGEYNELGGYYLITEDMAHVWVEAYVSDKGWITIDPTEFSTDFRTVLEKKRLGFVHRLGMYLDSINYYWDRMVIGYDLERQFQLVYRAGYHFSRFHIRLKNSRLLLWIAVPSCLAFMVITLWRIAGVARERRVLRGFLRKIQRRYSLEISPADGIQKLAYLSGDPFAKRFADTYCRAIYNDRKLTDEEYRFLKVLLQKI